MKIAFRKITPTVTPFQFASEAYSCEGTFRKLSRSLVEIEMHLNATAEMVCDRCAEHFSQQIEERLKLKIADGCFEGEDLDVVEVFDQVVDFDAIVVGEIEAIRSGYHFCENCKENQGE